MMLFYLWDISLTTGMRHTKDTHARCWPKSPRSHEGRAMTNSTWLRGSLITWLEGSRDMWRGLEAAVTGGMKEVVVIAEAEEVVSRCVRARTRPEIPLYSPPHLPLPLPPPPLSTVRYLEKIYTSKHTRDSVAFNFSIFWRIKSKFFQKHEEN